MTNSFLSWLEHALTVTEQDVVEIVVKAKQEVQLIAHEIKAALGWIADNTPAIAADIQRIESILQLVTIVDPAAKIAVLESVALANTAVAGLNAFASAYRNGTGDVESVVAGYSAIKSAQAAVAKATAIAVSAPTSASSAQDVALAA